ncbi:helix-turn-helix domain-containing protein [Dactylococcopsis salina]|uniref:Transcription regulator containing HTH domain n=1 Tax=Dactylococcopsis salina (strain PCC 8305) TaxID=13035 RepID=K9YWJ8_DACS8|nr:helix-turn-helix domain-containing protein [Dactylococcopsis salina]AFZ51279.1 putative transcription regulator containing HTH domain [Dactylococcopsis salina PCC 8305]
MTRTTNQNLTDITNIFPFVIKTEEQYNKALSITESLFFKENRNQEEEQALDVWTVLIEMYENQQFSLGSEATPVSILNTLMESQGITQADLVREEIGSSGVVSEIVNNKRTISNKQAKKLAKIFHVSPEVFIYFDY